LREVIKSRSNAFTCAAKAAGEFDDITEDDAEEEGLTIHELKRKRAYELHEKVEAEKAAKRKGKDSPTAARAGGSSRAASAAASHAAPAPPPASPARFVTGDPITHAYAKVSHSHAQFPEPDNYADVMKNPDGSVVMTGVPSKVYRATVVPQSTEGDPRFCLWFAQDKTSEAATLHPSHEGVWWWKGWEFTDGDNVPKNAP
jgi:hypothetical protein